MKDYAPQTPALLPDVIVTSGRRAGVMRRQVKVQSAALPRGIELGATV